MLSRVDKLLHSFDIERRPDGTMSLVYCHWCNAEEEEEEEEEDDDNDEDDGDEASGEGRPSIEVSDNPTPTPTPTPSPTPTSNPNPILNPNQAWKEEKRQSLREQQARGVALWEEDASSDGGEGWELDVGPPSSAPG